MPMVAIASSVATHSCSFEYLSPGGASIFLLQKIARARARLSLTWRAIDHSHIHQARGLSDCQDSDCTTNLRPRTICCPSTAINATDSALMIHLDHPSIALNKVKGKREH